MLIILNCFEDFESKKTSRDNCDHKILTRFDFLPTVFGVFLVKMTFDISFV